MTGAKAALAIAGTLLILVVVAAGGFALRWVTADIRGAGDARERILADGDFRIAAYDSFFALCAAVQAQEDRARALEDELAAGPTESRRGQIEASLTAVRSQRNRLIRTYNADASRDWTVGQFRDADLPYQLDTAAQETRCAA